MKFSRLKKAGFMDKVFDLNHKELYPGVKAYDRFGDIAEVLMLYPETDEVLVQIGSMTQIISGNELDRL